MTHASQNPIQSAEQFSVNGLAQEHNSGRAGNSIRNLPATIAEIAEQIQRPESLA